MISAKGKTLLTFMQIHKNNERAAQDGIPRYSKPQAGGASSATGKENKRVLKVMRDRWPNAADWHVVDDDHVQILDDNDLVLGVITSDELTCIWNECE